MALHTSLKVRISLILKSLTIKFIAASLIAAILGGLALFGYQILKPHDTETLARYFPTDTDIFISIMTETPPSTQLHLRSLLERADNLENRLRHSAQRDVADRFDISTDNIIAWLGKEVALGMSSEDGRVSIIVQVKDQRLAELTIEEIAAKVDNAGLSKYNQGRIGDFEVWSHPQLPSYALSEDLLILSDTTALRSIFGVIYEDAPSLQDTLEFQTASETMLSGRFASAFIRPQAALNNLASSSFITHSDLILNNLPAWAAISTAWRSEGILFSITTPDPVGYDHSTEAVSRTPFSDNPAGLVPPDTSLLIAIGFDPNIDNWRRSLGEIDRLSHQRLPGLPWQPIQIPDISNVVQRDGLVAGFNLALAAADLALGVNTKQDLLAHLEGQFIISLKGLNTDAAYSPESLAIGVSLNPDGAELLERTLLVVLDNIALLGVPVTRTEVDYALAAWRLGGQDKKPEPTLLLTDDWLFYTNSTQSMKEISAITSNGADSLLNAPSFRKAMAQTGTPQHLLIYADIRALAPDWADALPFDDSTRLLLNESVGHITITDPRAGEGVKEIRGMIGLFPDHR